MSVSREVNQAQAVVEKHLGIPAKAVTPDYAMSLLQQYFVDNVLLPGEELAMTDEMPKRVVNDPVIRDTIFEALSFLATASGTHPREAAPKISDRRRGRELSELRNNVPGRRYKFRPGRMIEAQDGFGPVSDKYAQLHRGQLDVDASV